LDEVGVPHLQKKGMKKSLSEAFPVDDDFIDWSAKPSKLSRFFTATKEGIPFKHVFPKNLISGVCGIVKALEGGVTKEQIDKSKSILGSDSGEILQLDRPKSLVTFGSKNPQRRELLKQGKVEEAYGVSKEVPGEIKEDVEHFLDHQRKFWSNPNAEQVLELTQLVANADDLTVEKTEQMFNVFSDKNVKDDENLIKRITLYNPVGEALLGNNLVALSVPGVTYTEDFHECSGMRLKQDDPAESKDRKGWNPTTAIFNGNVGFCDTHVASEQIMNLKLARLASLYGLNLDNDVDLIRWNVFLDTHEISPGEHGLEWVLDFPPPEHTFEELPIVKIPSDEDVEDYYRE